LNSEEKEEEKVENEDLEKKLRRNKRMKRK
jgi:hypothetical protein